MDIYGLHPLGWVISFFFLGWIAWEIRTWWLLRVEKPNNKHDTQTIDPTLPLPEEGSDIGAIVEDDSGGGSTIPLSWMDLHPSQSPRSGTEYREANLWTGSDRPDPGKPS